MDLLYVGPKIGRPPFTKQLLLSFKHHLKRVRCPHFKVAPNEQLLTYKGLGTFVSPLRLTPDEQTRPINKGLAKSGSPQKRHGTPLLTEEGVFPGSPEGVLRKHCEYHGFLY